MGFPTQTRVKRVCCITDFDRIPVPHVVIYVAAASTHSLYLATLIVISCTMLSHFRAINLCPNNRLNVNRFYDYLDYPSPVVPFCRLPVLLVFGMSSRLPESCAQITLTGNRFYQLCVNLDTGELILFSTFSSSERRKMGDSGLPPRLQVPHELPFLWWNLAEVEWLSGFDYHCTISCYPWTRMRHPQVIPD